MRSEAEFAARLRWWRRCQGWSQLEFAGRAGIPQRHLSFLESAGSKASRSQRGGPRAKDCRGVRLTQVELAEAVSANRPEGRA